MRCLNQTSEINFLGDNSTSENEVNFNKELIGTWRYGEDETIIETVKWHIKNMLQKTNFDSKTKLAVAVTKKNLIINGF